MINFPPNPTIGQQFVNTDGTVYRWDGVAWSVVMMNPTNPTVPQTASEGPDFPENPTIGQEYAFAENTWIWDGIAWVLKQASGTVDWDDIENKPTEFPPEPHNHVEADITDLDKYTKAEVDSSQVVQDGRLDLVEAKDDVQDGRLDALEIQDGVQNSRLDDIEEGTALDSRYVNITGDTITGDLTLDGSIFRLIASRPRIYWQETAQPVDAQLWEGFGVSGDFRLAARDDAGNTNGNVYIFARSGTAAEQANRVVRRGDGDARYLQLTGGTLTGNTTIANIAPHLDFEDTNGDTDAKISRLTRDAGRFMLQQRNDDGTLKTISHTFDDTGTTLLFGSSVITRQTGDARYANAQAMADLVNTLSELSARLDALENG